MVSARNNSYFKLIHQSNDDINFWSLSEIVIREFQIGLPWDEVESVTGLH